MILKLFEEVSDETLNKVGRRYNLFCLFTLPPYMAFTLASLFVPAISAWKPFGLVLQTAWVFIWVPNLMLIGVRAHRDWLTAAARLKEWGKADMEFFAAHVERMSLLRGEVPPDEPPRTLN
jgi:hypothetical protein